MPQASFNIYPQLLVVQFTDTSIVDNGKTIASWAWDFGDTTTSSTQNPSHTYSSPGKYKVVLTVTDSSASVLQSVRYIMVDTKPILPVTVEDLVKLKLPPAFIYQSAQLSAAISTWQLYIQPLVNMPGVVIGDAFNETAYPPIVNALVAYLAAYQIVIDFVSSAAMSAIGAGIIQGKGIVKRIETGPANAEFKDTVIYLKYLHDWMAELKEQLCKLAARSKINIPYCPPLPKPRFIPIKAGRIAPPLFNLWALNPSDIILAY